MRLLEAVPLLLRCRGRGLRSRGKSTRLSTRGRPRAGASSRSTASRWWTGSATGARWSTRTGDPWHATNSLRNKRLLTDLIDKAVRLEIVRRLPRLWIQHAENVFRQVDAQQGASPAVPELHLTAEEEKALPTFQAVVELEKEKDSLLHDPDMDTNETIRQAKLVHALVQLSEAEKKHDDAKLTGGLGMSDEAAKERRSLWEDRRAELLEAFPLDIEGSAFVRPAAAGRSGRTQWRRRTRRRGRVCRPVARLPSTPCSGSQARDARRRTMRQGRGAAYGPGR